MSVAYSEQSAHVETLANDHWQSTSWSFTSAVDVNDATESPPDVEWWLVGALAIEVRREGGQWVAIEDELGMYGEGDQPVEAVNDLVASMYQLRRELSDGAPPLSDEVRQDLETLNRILTA